jgi:Leishmanolysin
MHRLERDGDLSPMDENGFSPWAEPTTGPDELSAEAPAVIDLDRTALLLAPADERAALEGADGGDDPGAEFGPVLTSYASGKVAAGGDAFNIDIAFTGTWTAALQQAFIAAVKVSESIIVEGLQDVHYQGQAIDDIVITAELKSIDGVGGLLGRAGPTAIRTANSLPATASMQFDAADAARMAPELWLDVVQHEMFHALGFGSLWDRFTVNGQPIVKQLDSKYPIYVGPAALAAFNALVPDDEHMYRIPLQATGGPGTQGSHWQESVFSDELMTGYLNNVDALLSTMTAAAFQDFGYGIANPVLVAQSDTAIYNEGVSRYDFT